MQTHYLGEVENICNKSYSVANIFRTISTKFYQNRPGFVDDVTKTFGVLGVRSSNCCSLTKHNAKFHKVV